jgi:hypothetical protein
LKAGLRSGIAPLVLVLVWLAPGCRASTDPGRIEEAACVFPVHRQICVPLPAAVDPTRCHLYLDESSAPRAHGDGWLVWPWDGRTEQDGGAGLRLDTLCAAGERALAISAGGKGPRRLVCPVHDRSICPAAAGPSSQLACIKRPLGPVAAAATGASLASDGATLLALSARQIDPDNGRALLQVHRLVGDLSAGPQPGGGEPLACPEAVRSWSPLWRAADEFRLLALGSCPGGQEGLYNVRLPDAAGPPPDPVAVCPDLANQIAGIDVAAVPGAGIRAAIAVGCSAGQAPPGQPCVGDGLLVVGEAGLSGPCDRDDAALVFPPEVEAVDWVHMASLPYSKVTQTDPDRLSSLGFSPLALAGYGSSQLPAAGVGRLLDEEGAGLVFRPLASDASLALGQPAVTTAVNALSLVWASDLGLTASTLTRVTGGWLQGELPLFSAASDLEHAPADSGGVVSVAAHQPLLAPHELAVCFSTVSGTAWLISSSGGVVGPRPLGTAGPCAVSGALAENDRYAFLFLQAGTIVYASERTLMPGQPGPAAVGIEPARHPQVIDLQGVQGHGGLVALVGDADGGYAAYGLSLPQVACTGSADCHDLPCQDGLCNLPVDTPLQAELLVDLPTNPDDSMGVTVFSRPLLREELVPAPMGQGGVAGFERRPVLTYLGTGPAGSPFDGQDGLFRVDLSGSPTWTRIDPAGELDARADPGGTPALVVGGSYDNDDTQASAWAQRTAGHGPFRRVPPRSAVTVVYPSIGSTADGRVVVAAAPGLGPMAPASSSASVLGPDLVRKRARVTALTDSRGGPTAVSHSPVGPGVSLAAYVTASGGQVVEVATLVTPPEGPAVPLSRAQLVTGSSPGQQPLGLGLVPLARGLQGLSYCHIERGGYARWLWPVDLSGQPAGPALRLGRQSTPQGGHEQDTSSRLCPPGGLVRHGDRLIGSEVVDGQLQLFEVVCGETDGTGGVQPLPFESEPVLDGGIGPDRADGGSDQPDGPADSAEGADGDSGEDTVSGPPPVGSTACLTPFDLNTSGLQLADGRILASGQSDPFADPALYSCRGGASAPSQFLTYHTPPGGPWRVIATTDDPGTQADTVLSVRGSCGGAELSCNDDIVAGKNTRSTVSLQVPGDTQLLFAVGAYTVTVLPWVISVRSLPVVGQGEACDPQMVQNACQQMLVCQPATTGASCQPGSPPLITGQGPYLGPGLEPFGVTVRGQDPNGDAQSIEVLLYLEDGQLFDTRQADVATGQTDFTVQVPFADPFYVHRAVSTVTDATGLISMPFDSIIFPVLGEACDPQRVQSSCRGAPEVDCPTASPTCSVRPEITALCDQAVPVSLAGPTMTAQVTLDPLPAARPAETTFSCDGADGNGQPPQVIDERVLTVTLDTSAGLRVTADTVPPSSPAVAFAVRTRCDDPGSEIQLGCSINPQGLSTPRLAPGTYAVHVRRHAAGGATDSRPLNATVSR